MTASLVKAEDHTDVFESIAQNYMKSIAMPTAGAEAPGDASPDSVVAREQVREQGAAVVGAVSEPSFHLSPRLVLAIVLATVLLSALAIMTVATLAPQGFAAGS